MCLMKCVESKKATDWQECNRDKLNDIISMILRRFDIDMVTGSHVGILKGPKSN